MLVNRTLTQLTYERMTPESRAHMAEYFTTTIARLDAEIAELDTMIACSTGAGSVWAVLHRERQSRVTEREDAHELRTILAGIA